jgi:hypothetical protein
MTLGLTAIGPTRTGEPRIDPDPAQNTATHCVHSRPLPQTRADGLCLPVADHSANLKNPGFQVRSPSRGSERDFPAPIRPQLPSNRCERHVHAYDCFTRTIG